MKQVVKRSQMKPGSSVGRSLLACALSATMVMSSLPATALASTSSRLGESSAEASEAALASISFSDVPSASEWYSEAVYEAAHRGLFSGYADGSFRPDVTLTRAQAAVVFWHLLAPGADNGTTQGNETGMADVQDGDWYTAAANWAVANGIITGKTQSDGTSLFDPNGTLTRQELSVIVKRIADSYGTGELTDTHWGLDSMEDKNEVADWAKESMDWCIHYGVISGVQGMGCWKWAQGAGQVTRAMMAVVVINAINVGVLHEGTTQNQGTSSNGTSGSSTEPEATPAQDSESEVTPTPDPEPEVTPTPDPEPEAEVTPGTESGSTPTPTSDPESEAEVTPASDPEAEVTPGTESDSTPTPTSDPEPEPEVTPAITTVADPTVANVTYNGSEQTGVTCSDENVTLSGRLSATNAGSYTAYATTNSGYTFADGTTSKTITWTIAKATASDPKVISDLTYTGIEQTGVTCSDSSVTLSGTVHASAVGTYTAYAKTDANHVFANGSTSKTLTWTISTPSLGSSVTIDDGWYTVGYAANTSLCLDMTNGSMDELACTETYTKNSTDAQKWHFVKQSSGYYTIECGASGMVLGVAGGKTTNGTRVDQAYYHSGDAGQLWSIYKVNGKYVFKNKFSGRILDVSAGSTKSGGTVQIWDWNGSGAQGWTLTKTTEPTLKSTTVKTGWYNVVSYVDNEYLDVAGNGTGDGANIEIWGNTGAGCQKWYIKSLGDGTYSLQSGSSWEVGNTEVLDCLYGATTCGTNVHQWTWLNHDTQKWYIKQRTNGAYVFINKASGKRLDVSGGNADGNVQIWDANNTKAQTWKLTSTTEPAPTLVTDLSSGWYTVNSYVNNELLDVAGNSSDNGANVQIWGSTGAQGQKWYITNMGNGVYTLRSGSSWRDGKNMVLDCLNGGTANYTNVQQYTWNGTNAQKWYLKRYSTGGYVLENVASGKRLDVSGGNSCSNVQLYDKNQSNAQKWSLNGTSAPSTTNSNSGSNNNNLNTPTPYSGAAEQSMTNEEMTEAQAIFDAYNNWRASKGLNRVAWSDDCCNMAFGSVSGCAAIKSLTHRLGIPSAVQMNYSDILLYSTWRMDANEAVTRWANSDGHRKMMQCTTATVAGVACYNDSGTWYYAIVYNFSGCNQSGN